MEESVIKRVMPNSLEAEQSVIGSMIMDREAPAKGAEVKAFRFNFCPL